MCTFWTYEGVVDPGRQVSGYPSLDTSIAVHTITSHAVSVEVES